MQKPTLYLDGSHFSLAPGEAVETTLTLAKTGTRVSQYRVSVPQHCAASQFTTFRASSDQPWAHEIKVSLLDATQTVVEVKFEAREDRRSAPGVSHFVIAVEALDVGQCSSAVEGALEIAATTGITAAIDKPRQRSRRSATFALAVTNTGTAMDRVRLVIDAFDADAISVDFRPTETDVGAGDHRLFTISVSALRPIVVGKPEVHSATLLVKPKSGAEQPTHVIEWEQQPWLPKFAVALAVLALVGIGAWLLRPGPPELGAPPDPPTELSATPDIETAALQWKPGERGVSTEVRTIDCEEQNQLTAAALTKAEFSEVSSGVVSLPVDDDNPVCFQARSLDGDGQASIWSPVLVQTRVSNALPVPQNVELTGSVLTWEAESDYTYELIVEGEPMLKGIEDGLDLTRIDLGPGQFEVRVRSRLDDQYSGPSDPVLYVVEGLPTTTTIQDEDRGDNDTPSSTVTTTVSEDTSDSTDSPLAEAPEKPLPPTPWLLLYLATDQPTKETVDEIRQYLDVLYATEGADQSNITVFQLSPDTDSKITVQLSDTSQLPLGGQWVVGDLLDGQSAKEAAEICAKFRPIMQDQAAAALSVFCIAFDGVGNQQPASTTNEDDE